MLLDDVATYLDAQSASFTKLSGSVGNLTKAFMPDDSPAPDTIVTVYETGGIAPTHVFSTGAGVARAFENPRLQVIARSSRYATARNLAETAFTILDGFAGGTSITTAATPLYMDITAVQSPFSLGRDENGRYLVSVNFDVRKTTG